MPWISTANNMSGSLSIFSFFMSRQTNSVDSDFISSKSWSSTSTMIVLSNYFLFNARFSLHWFDFLNLFFINSGLFLSFKFVVRCLLSFIEEKFAHPVVILLYVVCNYRHLNKLNCLFNKLKIYAITFISQLLTHGCLEEKTGTGASCHQYWLNTLDFLSRVSRKQ